MACWLAKPGRGIESMPDESAAGASGPEGAEAAEGGEGAAKTAGGGDSEGPGELDALEMSKELGGVGWDGAAEAVVEVLPGDDFGAAEARGEGVPGGEERRGTAELGQDRAKHSRDARQGNSGNDTVGGGQGSEDVRPLEEAARESQAVAAERGSGEGSEGGESGGVRGREVAVGLGDGAEEIPFAVEAEGDGEGRAETHEGKAGKAGNGSASGGREEGGGEGNMTERAEAVALAAVEPVAEEMRGGLGRIEGKIEALATLVESMREDRDEKNGSGDVLGEIRETIKEQGDLLGLTAKKVEQNTGAMEERIEAGVKAIEESFANVDAFESAGKGMKRLEGALRTYSKDISRRIKLASGPQRWAAIVAVAVAAPACVVAGAFVEQEWRVLPIEDPTGGWRGHIWENYGKDIMGCVQQGFKDGSSFTCVVDVRESVERVRSGSRR